MNILIASDIHGSAYWTRRLLDAIESSRPDCVALLGDLLYHGPRNDLPRDYDPKSVASMLNGLAKTGRVIAARGNCDAEVDQMVLDFPCMADYSQLMDDFGRTLVLTHGHVYGAGLHGSADLLPPVPCGSAVLYGHTHIKASCEAPGHSGIWAFNPGSLSIPKDGTHSYGWYESGLPLEEAFSHRTLSEG